MSSNELEARKGWLSVINSQFNEFALWKKVLIALSALTLAGGVAARVASDYLGEGDTQWVEAASSRSSRAEVDASGGRALTPESKMVVEGGQFDDDGLGDLFSGGDLGGELGPYSGKMVLNSLAAEDSVVSEVVRSEARNLGPESVRSEARNFSPGEPAAPMQSLVKREGPSLLDEWSPTMMKGGFTFFIALCMGLTLRAFAKFFMILTGVVLLAISGAAYAGFLEVDWASMQTQFESTAMAAQSQIGGFKTFLQGSLPSGMMGGLGLLTGLKKK